MFNKYLVQDGRSQIRTNHYVPHCKINNLDEVLRVFYEFWVLLGDSELLNESLLPLENPKITELPSPLYPSTKKKLFVSFGGY